VIIPIIRAGGSGTRLWPMSLATLPKQFLALTDNLTMWHQSAGLEGLELGRPIVTTNDDHRFLVAEKMTQRRLKADIILDPVGRNSAPAIALAAKKLLESKTMEGASPVMLVLASDHVIQDTNAFQESVLKLLPEVQSGKFGTLGILPTEPATGDGYIKRASYNSLSVVESFLKSQIRKLQNHILSRVIIGIAVCS